MERHRKPASRKAPGGRIKRKPTEQPPTGTALKFPNIEELIEEGQITIGSLYPIGCVAAANDDHDTLAMLVQRRGETLLQLLTRLDQAIGKALDENIYTDEVNS